MRWYFQCVNIYNRNQLTWNSDKRRNQLLEQFIVKIICLCWTKRKKIANLIGKETLNHVTEFGNTLFIELYFLERKEKSNFSWRIVNSKWFSNILWPDKTRSFYMKFHLTPSNSTSIICLDRILPNLISNFFGAYKLNFLKSQWDEKRIILYRFMNSHKILSDSIKFDFVRFDRILN